MMLVAVAAVGDGAMLLLVDRHLLVSTIGVLFINICSPVDLLTAFLFFLAVGGSGGVVLLILLYQWAAWWWLISYNVYCSYYCCNTTVADSDRVDRGYFDIGMSENETNLLWRWILSHETKRFMSPPFSTSFQCPTFLPQRQIIMVLRDGRL